MSQFEEFRKRVERTKAEADAAAHAHVARQQIARSDGGRLGFRWRFLEVVSATIGEIFAHFFVYILGIVLVVAALAAWLGISLQAAFGVALVCGVLVLALMGAA